MKEEVVYMLGIVGVGFLVNYALRALPFLLFSGRSRELPPWVDRLGKVISPVIIGCLIVYSYSGSAWRTPWPYLAGVVTIALQVWKRNPLVSIIAGTAVYMLLINCCGCATHRTLELDAKHPAIEVSTLGIKFGNELVQPEEVSEILEDYDVPHDRVIHILLNPEVKDLRPARTLMGYLSRAGYTRPVLVTKRHAESENLGVVKKPSAATTSSAAKPAPKRVIRYKRADE